MEPIRVWFLPDVGGRVAIQANTRPFDDPRWEECIALPRADFDALAAEAADARTLRTERDSLRQERDEERELEAAVDATGPPPGYVVEINSASREDLMRLPRVGEALANRIIEGRPYRRLTDLLEVDGIGPGTYRALKPMLRIEPPAE